MNTWEFSRLTKLPMRLWRRWNIWRAKRMYWRVVELRVEAEMLKIDAEMLMRKHAKPPCPLFDGLDSDRRK